MKEVRKLRLYIIAGPNGSGKTTFANKFLPFYAHCREFINADLLAKGLSPLDPDRAAVGAGRMVLQRISEFAKRRFDFAFETTLSGRSYVRMFERLKDAGYKIHLFYLWIPGVKLALKRISKRVKEGGHDVPAGVVKRRYEKSLRNLFGFYWNLPDSISIIDNSGPSPRLIAAKRGVHIKVANERLFEKIQRRISHGKT